MATGNNVNRLYLKAQTKSTVKIKSLNQKIIDDIQERGRIFFNNHAIIPEKLQIQKFLTDLYKIMSSNAINIDAILRKFAEESRTKQL